MLSECVQQLKPCFLNHEMAVIRGNFIVALANNDERKLDFYKSCFREVS